jgi:glycosyltransferase involved in cell wall biosynthesis
MLEQITPLILTYNEAPNIERTLGKLSWAKDIVVVDSGSSDTTRELLARHPAVRVYERAFTGHADQWNFGLGSTAIRTDWVLALDADFVLSDALLAELRALVPSQAVGGLRASFVYCIHGKPLRGSLYPPVTVLFRRARARYVQQGHTQRVSVEGETESLHAPIYHDDRKPIGHWLASQARYMRIEADKLRGAVPGELRWQDRIRRLRVIAPFGVLFYLLLVRGLILDGWPGVFYACQRAVAEAILSLYLIEGDLSLRIDRR